MWRVSVARHTQVFSAEGCIFGELVVQGTHLFFQQRGAYLESQCCDRHTSFSAQRCMWRVSVARHTSFLSTLCMWKVSDMIFTYIYIYIQKQVFSARCACGGQCCDRHTSFSSTMCMWMVSVACDRQHKFCSAQASRPRIGGICGTESNIMTIIIIIIIFTIIIYLALSLLSVCVVSVYV